ncbi:flagellar hook-length control protein FliK [Methylomonas sp. 2BW1-5-20]|uniref:flagellar hook-length control protein FliK n=1 Tax=Methylomonas sp. 2BW1-5-20 TaxID=3376686 RepID=UPI00405260C8
MDVKLLLDAKLAMTIEKSVGALPELKLNQVLDAKVVTNQAILNALTVSIGDKTVTLQSPKALAFQPGQTLQLQVVKLLPTLEFKIVGATQPALSNAIPAQAAEATLLKLLPATVATAAATPPLPGNLPAALASGERVQAQVIQVGKQTLTIQLTPASPGASQGAQTASSTGDIRISLDSKQLLWNDPQAKQALMPGSRIDLMLVKNADKPVFNVALAVPSVEEQITSAFKQLLPIQVSPAELLTQLGPLLKPADSDKTTGEILKQLAREILLQIPDKSKLFEPGTLKQAIAQSGLFMEHELVNAETANSPPLHLQDDFKFKLSKLIAQLNFHLAGPADTESAQKLDSDLLKETLQKAEGNLARLTLDQLNSLPRDDSPKQVWILELPFFNKTSPETLQLIVEQDKQAAGESGQKNWVVSITITPPELATIHCKISCYDGSVNTRFWSESTDTVDKINARLDYLREQFEQKGLKPGFMDVQQGKPAQPNPQTLPPQNLLSEKV